MPLATHTSLVSYEGALAKLSLAKRVELQLGEELGEGVSVRPKGWEKATLIPSKTSVNFRSFW